MFRRSESARERTLLKLVESLQTQNRDLTDRVMWLSGRAWQLPPTPDNIVPPPDYVEPSWTATPEQEPVY